MKTYLECIPCFFNQALEAAKICRADKDAQKQIIDDVAREIPGFSLSSSPPEMAVIIHDVVRKHTGIPDPYSDIKKNSNLLVLNIYDELKRMVKKSDDSLLRAVEFAAEGNIIDYGVKNLLNVDHEIEKILKDEPRKNRHKSSVFFQYNDFREALEAAENILYLADNAGETVFDRVLLEEISAKGKKVTYAVKEKPIVNDALAGDAVMCGVDKVAKIISSGSYAPGTVLSLCSKYFLDLFKNADMVISKGQGNFEALSHPGRKIFFLFMAKCPVVAVHVGCDIGDILLLGI